MKITIVFQSSYRKGLPKPMPPVHIITINQLYFNILLCPVCPVHIKCLLITQIFEYCIGMSSHCLCFFSAAHCNV